MTTPEKNSRLWLAFVLLAITQFMVILEFSITNVALPAIQEDFNFSQQNLQWVISAYSLTFGGFLLLGGRTADLLGRRRLFMIGHGLFSLASLICGLAQLQWMLLAARCLQGLGAAFVSPAALSLVTTTFKEGSQRNRALGIWGIVSSMGFAAGVIFGGILTDGINWRWIFFVNVPIGIITIALAPILLDRNHQQVATSHIDIAGAVTITSGFVALVYAPVQALEAGWGSFRTIFLFSVSLILFVAFIVIESRSQAPLVPLQIFRKYTLISGNIVSLLASAVVASMLFILTLYMQNILGYSASQAGFAFLPHALAAMVAAPVCSHIVNHFGVKLTLVSGMGMLSLGLLLLTQIHAHGSFVRDLLPGIVITGFGIVFCHLTVIIATISSVSSSEQGIASGIINTAQQVGSAIGVAIIVTVSTARTTALSSMNANTVFTQKEAMLGGFQYALTTGVGLALIGFLIALFVFNNVSSTVRKRRKAC